MTRIVVTIIVALVLWASSAIAEKLLFISTPEPITEATREALVGWGVDIETIDIANLGTDIPSAYERAEQLADEHDAAAVIWMAPSNDRMALWIYEQDEGLLATRRVDQPENIDAETAAALGLSIKTVLRHTQIAPPKERALAVEPAPASPRSLFFAATFGARARSFGSSAIDARVGVDAQYSLPRRPLLIYAQAVTGPGYDFESALLDGRLDDTTVGLGAGTTLRFRGGLAVHGRGGLELHITRLEGTLVELGRSASVSRVNPAVSLGIRTDLELTSRWRAGLYGGLSANLRTQDYLVYGEAALSPPSTEFLFGIYFGAAAL